MKKKIILWTLVLLAALIAYNTIPGMVESGIPSIYYVTPSVKTYENIVNCQGVIQSENIYDIYAPAAFVPESIPVSVGDKVKAGDLLIAVDQDATLRLAQGAADSVIEGITDEAKNAVSSVKIEDLLSAFGLAGMLGGFDLSGITDAVEGPATVIADSATPFTAAVAEDIRSPIDGVVTEVNAAANGLMPSGKRLFTVQDTRSFKVVASVNEADIYKIQVGDTATIYGVGFPGMSFSGEVCKIYPTARKALSGTGTDTVVDIEIIIFQPGEELRHGFSAKVEISAGQSYSLVTVPYEAVRQDGKNMEYVYTYEGGIVKKTPIVTGKELVNEVEVLDGLNYDSIVIFNPDDVSGEGAIANIKGRADDA